MANTTVAVTDDSFEADVINSEVPVLVDYWAEWCGPCKMIGPILEELAAEMGDKVKIAKLNIDENQMTPAKYGIRGIPTLLLFKNGEVAGQQVGAMSKSQLQQFIEQSI
jgi:thioredoxin 1